MALFGCFGTTFLDNQFVEPMENLINRLRDKQTLAKLIGEAPVFLKAIAQLPSVARSEATVLITGETGTGKELVARAIHYLSARVAFPFVPLNCGSLPETLLEDELFGHERGAFTDARTPRRGLITQAERGTLFLDEVDTLAAKAQVALLRVLQDKMFRTLGSSREQEADVRIVAATNAPLDQLVRAGGFRVDLYYRLRVFSINLPPLRDRKKDILSLSRHFLEKHTPLAGRCCNWLQPLVKRCNPMTGREIFASSKTPSFAASIFAGRMQSRAMTLTFPRVKRNRLKRPRSLRRNCVRLRR